MKVKLIVVGGDAKAAEIKLKLPAVIGRGREANLTLPHPLVSRKHCELFEHAGKLCVRDLGSLNGTYINNERIADSTLLPSGDLLTVGSVTFRAVYSNQVVAAPLKTAGEATVRAAANNTTVEPPRPVENRQPQRVAQPLAPDVPDEFDEVEEIDEGLVVDEQDAAQIEELEAEDVDEIAESDAEPAGYESTVPAPLAADPKPRTLPAPPARFAAAASASAHEADGASEEIGDFADDFSSGQVEDFAPRGHEEGLEDIEEAGFLDEVDTVEGDEPVVPPEQSSLTPETIDITLPPNALPRASAPGSMKPPVGLDEPEEGGDDALNQFFKGLR
jgi:predicted component of type VI protein secretion system